MQLFITPSLSLPAQTYWKILVLTKIRVLFSGSISETPDLENFDPASRFCCQQNPSTDLAPTLFNLYTNDLPVTRSRGFIYADDICCALQAETLSEKECALTADLAHLAKYCQLCRLIPSTSKTVTSIFHLHNNRSRRELNVHMNGRRLKHDPYPVYLGVTF